MRRPVPYLIGVAFLVLLGYLVYTECRIEVPSLHMAVLTRKTGEDLANGDEIAPGPEYKGVQLEVLTEGRYFYNPYVWDWVVVPQIEIPEGQLGVRTRLYGDNLPPGEVIAWEENQKGIIPDVLTPGRWAINAKLGDQTRKKGDSFAELIQMFEPVTVPAGFKGVVTQLSSPMPADPNRLLSESDRRGVQQDTLDPGTYYVNPYVTRINLVDCRSQRFNLASGGDMGFPSKDGFWVRLEGVIEFRVDPALAAQVYVTYNDNRNGDQIDEEVIAKVILPNARSYSRLRGSNHSGREFISGDTRVQFQKDFQSALAQTCSAQGIEIIQALITKIHPPQQISEPVQQRQIAFQQEKQYLREIEQQLSEQELAVEQELVKRKQQLVQAEQEVVKVVTDAQRSQEVALIQVDQRLKVAEFELAAARDQSLAIRAQGKARADVIRFDNAAVAAGWEESVKAFEGDGQEFARWVMLRKLAPAFRSMMVNTADSPLMDVFRGLREEAGEPTSPASLQSERGGSN